MMLGAWMGLGTVALVVSLLVWGNRLDNVVFGLFTALLWGVWALAATDVERVTQCCVVSHTYESMALLGVIMGGMMLYTMLRGTGSFIKTTARSGRRGGNR